MLKMLFSNTVYRTYALAAVLTAALIIRFVFAVLTPLGTDTAGLIPGFNDELSHYNYIRYLAEEKRLPVQTMSINHPEAFTRNEFEYYQPPLFYLMAIPFYYLGTELSGFSYLTIRALCIVCGLLSIVLSFRLILILFPGRFDKALTGALLLAFMGVHVRFSSLISNDSLLWLIATAYTYLLVLKTYGRQSRSHDFMLTVLIGAGMLTKSSFLLLLPALFVPYISLGSFRQTILNAKVPLLILLGGLGICAPWYIRNLQLYNELLALRVGSGVPTGLGLPLVKTAAFILYQNAFSCWFPFITWPYSIAAKTIAAVFTVTSTAIAAYAVCIAYRIWKKPELRKLILLCAALLVPLGAGAIRFSLMFGQVNFRHLMALQSLWAGMMIVVLYRVFKKTVPVNAIIISCCITAYAAAFLLL